MKMPISYMCPYFIKDAGKNVIYCECAKMKFPDRMAYRAIVYKYCAHPDGYRNCEFKAVMDKYYERKFNSIDAENQKANR